MKDTQIIRHFVSDNVDEVLALVKDLGLSLQGVTSCQTGMQTINPQNSQCNG